MVDQVRRAFAAKKKLGNFCSINFESLSHRTSFFCSVAVRKPHTYDFYCQSLMQNAAVFLYERKFCFDMNEFWFDMQ